MKRAISTNLVTLFALCAVLAGCALLSVDFDKAIQIGVLPTVKSEELVQRLHLPSGDADFRFVAPNYDCKTPLRAEFHIVGKSKEKVLLDHQVNLSDLVWPKSREGCLEVGYMGARQEGGVRPLRFHLTSDNDDVELRLTLLTEFEGATEVRLWVVYGDRQPTDRMLAK